MQLHPGSFRNHRGATFADFGRDKGADIPRPTDYVRGLKPLLDRFGDAPGFTLGHALIRASGGRELVIQAS